MLPVSQSANSASTVMVLLRRWEVVLGDIVKRMLRSCTPPLLNRESDAMLGQNEVLVKADDTRLKRGSCCLDQSWIGNQQWLLRGHVLRHHAQSLVNCEARGSSQITNQRFCGDFPFCENIVGVTSYYICTVLIYLSH